MRNFKNIFLPKIKKKRSLIKTTQCYSQTLFIYKIYKAEISNLYDKYKIKLHLNEDNRVLFNNFIYLYILLNRQIK